MNSSYKLVLMPKSYCPNCNVRVHWLHQPEALNSSPSFFICFNCHYIGQSGVGPVVDEETDSKPR